MKRLALSIAAALAVAGPLAAQQPYPWIAFASKFDGEAPVLIDGRVVEVEFTSPQSRVRIKVKERGKPDQLWDFMFASSIELRDRGFTPDLLRANQRVKIRGYQAKDKRCAPACVAIIRDLVFPNGDKWFLSNRQVEHKPR